MLAVAASIAKNLDVLYNPEVNSSVLDATWAQLGGAYFFGDSWLWLAYNYRRQVRLELADR